MKSIIGGSVITLLLVFLALPGLVFAGAEGSTADGSFKFALNDGEIRFVEFKAAALGEGKADGEMTYSDPAAVPVPDPDNPEKEQSPGVLVRAKFDCMDTFKNTAVIGGEIYESNVPNAIGMRVLLVVEDNGIDGEKDRVSWGVYQPPATGWVPVDAEDPNDKGASLTWWATDFERRDDVGFPMPPGKLVACKSFPLASYDFPEIKYAGGDVAVSQR
jgi:hypothetical protein